MKNVFVTFLQFVLFFLVFFVFSFVRPFHLEHVVGITSDGPRVFIWDGLLISALLFVLILGIQAVRKRMGTAALWTTAAFALAVVVGLAAKVGFKTNTSF